MVKRTIIILIITALLFSIAILEEVYITTSLNELYDKTNNLQVAIEASEGDINTPENLQLLNDLIKHWDTSEGYICLTVNHNELEVIGQEIVRLRASIEENDKGLLTEYFEVIKLFADKHRHTMSFTIQNIL